MDFRIKSALQWVVNYLPFSTKIHQQFQKYGSKSLWSNEHFDEKLRIGKKYLNVYQELVLKKPHSALDFGAGFDLIIPLFLSKNGIVNHVFDQSDKLIPELVKKREYDIFQDKSTLALSHTELLKFRTITHSHAELSTLVKSGFSFDLIHSTVVLEYLKKEEIETLLSAFKELLSPNGVLMLTINYRDHWSHGDSKISDYNFLKYSESEWCKFCPPTCSQNRMRHSDYINLMRAAKFNLKREEIISGKPSELDRLILHSDFESYIEEDLLVKESFLVMTK